MNAMPVRYVAYGLELISTFPLPGMLPAADRGLGAPSLRLEMVADTELESSWSGPDGPPLWRGRLGDGTELSIERGPGGDVRFTNGTRAQYLLDTAAGLLVCAPQEDGLDWQRTLLSKVLASISVMLGYEALHASAVRSPRGAVAIAAPSGMGKTTLALELIRRGWPLVSDDVLALAITPGGLIAHPGTPHMNVALTANGGPALEEVGTTLGILGGERWLAVRETVSEPQPVRAICLFERDRGLAVKLSVLPANPLRLAPYMLGLLGDAERERRRFELYGDLMETVLVMHVTCDETTPPGRVAELIEDALTDRPAELAATSAA